MSILIVKKTSPSNSGKCKSCGCDQAHISEAVSAGFGSTRSLQTKSKFCKNNFFLLANLLLNSCFCHFEIPIATNHREKTLSASPVTSKMFKSRSTHREVVEPWFRNAYLSTDFELNSTYTGIAFVTTLPLGGPTETPRKLAPFGCVSTE